MRWTTTRLRMPMCSPKRAQAGASRKASSRPEACSHAAERLRGAGRSRAPRRAAHALAKPDASQRLADDIGTIHFIGIGGIGMSGIAEIMHNLGYKVQGSDVADSANVKRLRDKGIPLPSATRRQSRRTPRRRRLFLGDQARQSRVRSARAQRLPVVRRAEMLAEIMRLKSCVAIAGTTARPRRRRWSPRCSMRAASIRP
jgi:hypothetical protein